MIGCHLMHLNRKIIFILECEDVFHSWAWITRSFWSLSYYCLLFHYMKPWTNFCINTTFADAWHTEMIVCVPSGEASMCFLSLWDRCSSSVLRTLDVVSSPFCSRVRLNNKAHCKQKDNTAPENKHLRKFESVDERAGRTRRLGSLTRQLSLSCGFIKGECCLKASNLSNLVNCLNKRQIKLCVFWWATWTPTI